MILASHFAESSADYWVYNLGNSQLKRTLFVSAVLLSLFGFSNVFPMQIWDSCLTKNHLSSKFKHCHSLVHSAAVFLSSGYIFPFEFRGGKISKKGIKNDAAQSSFGKLYVVRKICWFIELHVRLYKYFEPHCEYDWPIVQSRPQCNQILFCAVANWNIVCSGM